MFFGFLLCILGLISMFYFIVKRVKIFSGEAYSWPCSTGPMDKYLLGILISLVVAVIGSVMLGLS